MPAPTTLFDKLWDAHVVTRSAEGLDLLHIDRSLLTDLSGMLGLEELEAHGRRGRNPELHVAIPDHVVATGTSNTPKDAARHKRYVETLERLAARAGIRHWARGSGYQGIVHVVGLERALTLPGVTLVCGDSHTSTHGAVGALAFGIGSTEVEHVLATQTLWLKKPRRARIRVDGSLDRGVSAKDLALFLIGRLGADYGREHAIEFAGPVVEAMSIEARATLCNMAVELGARVGLVAPDETTVRYVEGREFAPRGSDWDAAVASWSTLRTDSDATFDKEVAVDGTEIAPQVTWGISPEHVAATSGAVPSSIEPGTADYIGLAAGQSVADLPIDYVFIGSCANARIEDLRAAAAIVRGRQVADGVTAWVVPGSEAVMREGEREGLDGVFLAAGFEWRKPGCSMCVGVNGDLVPPGKRCVSTSNRNFMGRQGPGARTHLASPVTAAAAAIAGRIVDPRAYMEQAA